MQLETKPIVEPQVTQPKDPSEERTAKREEGQKKMIPDADAIRKFLEKGNSDNKKQKDDVANPTKGVPKKNKEGRSFP